MQGKNCYSAKKQSTIKILQHAIVDDWEDQKLVDYLNRDGLTAVSLDFQRMFVKYNFEKLQVQTIISKVSM